MTPLPPSSRLRPAALTLPLLLALAACGGGGGSDLGPGKDVITPDIENYTADHNGYSRVRLDRSEDSDADVLAQFDDENPADPAGYRNLIKLNEDRYAKYMFVEVIGEVETNDGPEKVTRILRMTADEKPFTNVRDASGKFYFRGENYVWASVDGGPLQSGSDSSGLVDLVVDFDTGTADIDLRTTVAGTSTLRTELKATGLPFNIRTGAYGGDVTMQLWQNDDSDILSADGSLRGNLGGTTTYALDNHQMTTSGLYTISGTDQTTGKTVKADGVFFGTDPNALP
jgi:hypothetical protein